MKKSYTFFRNIFKGLSIISFCMLLIAATPLFGQVRIVPAGNPSPMRLQPATFTVTLQNDGASDATNLTLKASASAGYTISPPQITGINIAAGYSVNRTFTVTPNCDVAQIGGIITYILEESGGTFLGTTQTLPITITESDFQLTMPSNSIANTVSNDKEYTRIWSIQATAVQARISNMKITNTCNKSNIEITKVEVVDNIGGYLSDLEAPLFDASQAGKYIYYLDGTVFSKYGDSFFDEGETVYIRETYHIKACAPTTSTYTIEYGDGTQWCSNVNFGMVTTSVVQPEFSSDQDFIARPDPTSQTGGKITRILLREFTNTSTDPDAIMRNLYYRFVFDNIVRVSLKKLCLTDAAGNPLPIPPLFEGTESTGTLNILFDGKNLVPGLIDADGDGVYNDLAPGATIYFMIELEFDLTDGDCKNDLFYYAFNNQMRYNNTCGSEGGSTSSFREGLSYSSPKAPIMTPPNISPNTKTTLTFYQNNSTSVGSIGNTGFLINAINYSHHIIITLPEGFDYDVTQPGVRINGLLINKDSVRVDTDPVTGRVVLDIHNTRAGAVNLMTYSIDMVADPGITNKMDKNFSIHHEWGFNGDPVRFTYACDEVLLNYQVHTSIECLNFYNFDVQRMTFGWTDYDKTTRITSSNIAGYPNVRRDVAGPYDNVDFISSFELQCNIPYDGTFRWLADMAYDAHDLPEPGGCFLFTDPDNAVEVKIMNNGVKATSWITELDLEIIPDGDYYTYRVDLTPYTYGNSGYSMQVGDTVIVTYKMQTTENLPNELTILYDMTMSSYLVDDNIVPNPALDTDTVSWIKNFHVVDYAVKELAYGINTTNFFTNSFNLYHENKPDNFVMSITRNRFMANDYVFPNEYRPLQYATYYESTFNSLWDITEVGIRECQLHPTNYTAYPTVMQSILTPADYTITHASGKTTVAVTKQLQSNLTKNVITSGSYPLFGWYINGAPYCLNNSNSSISGKVNYLYYPSSERTDITGEITYVNVAQYGPVLRRFYYDTPLSTSNAYQPAVTSGISWNFTIQNNSQWNSSDFKLPNSWLSVSIPSHIPASSLFLTDGIDIWSGTDFIYYDSDGGKNKYWVLLGDLELPNPTYTKDFTFSCMPTACEAFSIDLVFSRTPFGYPVNPAVGFTGDSPPCPGRETLTLHGIPPASALQLMIIDPPFDAPTGYSFCNPHIFTATFNNSQTNPLTAPVLKMVLCQGLELDQLSISATQGGVDVDIISVVDVGPSFERTVTITLDPATTITAFGTPGSLIYVDFDLKPTCGFSNGYSVYITNFATTLCGNTIEETKHTTPIVVDGINLESNYQIFDFSVGTGIIDLTTLTPFNLTATVELVTPSQTLGDYIAISIPPNMGIASNNILDFDFLKVESGNDVYIAEIPPLNPHNEIDVDITLTPKNPALWNCEDVTVFIYTGATVELLCGSSVCGIDAKHDNEKSELLQILKNDVDFLAGSISATGTFNSSTSESVFFSGTLTLPVSSSFSNLEIEVYSNQSGTLQPISGATFTIPSVTTDAFTTTFDFTSITSFVIPALDMCHLYLVINKTATQNPYICNEASIQVPPPSYTLTATSYSVCQGSDLPVGISDPITGYTYTWFPTTYIVGSNIGTSVTVNYPTSVSGEQTLNVTIDRMGCTVGGVVTITMISTPTLITSSESDIICSGVGFTHPLASATAGSTFAWELLEPLPSGITHTGATTGTGDITGTLTNSGTTPLDVTYRVALTGTFPDYCTNTQTVTITVSTGVTPSVTISADPGISVCTGSSVTFTAASTNGGSAPSYQWNVNGTNVGEGDNTLTYIPAHNDIVRVTLTSDAVCASPSTVTDQVTMTVNSTSTPSVSISANPGISVCTGTSVTFTAAQTNGGSAPSYQWNVGGSNVGDGTINHTYIPSHGDVITVTMTSNALCASSTTASNQVTMTVSPASAGGSIAGSATVCTGTNSTVLTLSGHTGSVVRWERLPDGETTWETISNTTATYTATDLTQTTQYRAVVKSGDCAEANSATATVTVSPASAGGSIAGSATVCTGTNSTVLTLSGHTGSIVSWERLPDGETTWETISNTTATYTATNLTKTTQYRVVVKSGDCAETNSATATVTVITSKTTSITINSPEPVCQGASVTFTANVTNEGTNPTYLWSVNGANKQSGPSNTFTYTPNHGDMVTATLTSDEPCASPASVTSSEVILYVLTFPDMPIIIIDPLLVVPGTEVDLMDAILIDPTMTYVFYENADKTGEITGAVITYNPPKDDYYVVANNGYCVGEVSQINLRIPCPVTIMDSDSIIEYKVTYLAGLCWTENLRATKYPATDELIPFANPYTCSSCPAGLDTIFGLLYTWYAAVGVEMRATSIQGICPNGWRIPTQAEWRKLENFNASQLRSKRYWIDPQGVGTDEFGFDARPAGWYNSSLDRFQDLYGFAGWWASDAPDGTYANSFTIAYHCNIIMEEVKKKTDALSVRCVMEW